VTVLQKARFISIFLEARGRLSYSCLNETHNTNSHLPTHDCQPEAAPPGAPQIAPWRSDGHHQSRAGFLPERPLLAIDPRRASQRLQPEVAAWFMINLHGAHGEEVFMGIVALSVIVTWGILFLWEDDL
jgi:hypothetical protein